jgi:hypothetical protein
LPTLTETTLRPTPRTRTGVARASVVPSPSWASSLDAQAHGRLTAVVSAAPPLLADSDRPRFSLPSYVRRVARTWTGPHHLREPSTSTTWSQ